MSENLRRMEAALAYYEVHSSPDELAALQKAKRERARSDRIQALAVELDRRRPRLSNTEKQVILTAVLVIDMDENMESVYKK